MPHGFFAGGAARRASTPQVRRLALESLEPRTLLSGRPILSEFLSSNDTGLQDRFGNNSDWIEIHNPDSTAVDMTGWQLQYKNNTPWTFPAMSLGPGEFRVIFATARNLRDPADELHTDFNISKDGGSGLRLLDNTGAVVDQYAPFPALPDDTSYGAGQEVTETKLLAEGAAARYFIPTDGSLGTSWTEPSFADSSWTAGTTGLGYAEMVPGFAVRGYKAASTYSVTNLATAQALIDLPANQSWTQAETTASINYLNSGGAGHFVYDRTFPGMTLQVVQTHYAAEATGTIHIPAAGTYTFGVNSDDGFRLAIQGASFTAAYGGTVSSGALLYDAIRGAGDTLGTVTFAAAGDYPVDLLYFQNTGTAEVELFAAAGNFNSWGATQTWRLVGDTLNGGLAIKSLPITGTEHSIAGKVDTNVRGAMDAALAQVRTASGDPNAVTSLYTRLTFNTADLGSLSSLALKMAYDDGYVAYLNGVEVARRNAPTSAAWNSLALSSRQSEVQATSFETVDLSAWLNAATPGHLQATGNVLAIQTLLSSSQDADLLIVPEISQIESTELGDHFFATPTPGAANSRTYWQKAADAEFSVEHGFYNDPFLLQLSSETAGARIYYTLDSSDPWQPTLNRMVSGITRSGTTATATATSHGYTVGQLVRMSGALQPEYNGIFSITAVSANTFSYTVTGSPTTPATGLFAVEKVETRVTALAYAAGTATAQAPGHGLVVGDLVRIEGADQAEYNGDFIVTATTGNSFSYAVKGSPVTPATGQLSAARLGQQYVSPLVVDTTMVVRARVYHPDYEPSNSVTQTYLFLDDVIGQPAWPEDFPPSWDTLPADYEMDPRITADPAYRNVMKEALESLPTVSLVSDKVGLFDPVYGIYANQATSLNANYNGDPLQTPASLEYFEAGGESEFQINAVAQIYGGVGRNPPYKKHSIRVLFKEPYGPTKLDFPLFGDEAADSINTVVFKAGFNDAWPANGTIVQYIRDAFDTNLHILMGQPDHHSQFVHLYVDGLYWGMYTATERPDEAFSAEYMGGEQEDWESNNSGYSQGVTTTVPLWNDLMNKTAVGLNATAWQAGANGFNVTGYQAGTAGVTSKFYQSATAVTSLAAAQQVIDTLGTPTTAQTDLTVNYLATGSGGRFGSDLGFPGKSVGTTISNCVVETTTTISIPSSGNWTFGISSDDGFRLSITGASFSSVAGTGTTIVGGAMQFDGTRTAADSLGVVNFASAGSYTVRLLYYQNTSDAELEWFAAKGSFTSWGGTSAWRLVGDTGNAGLLALSSAYVVDSLADADAVLANPNLQVWSNRQLRGTVNYVNSGSDGHYASGGNFPGVASGNVVENFVVVVESTISIPATGWWTFGVNSDDGFRLTLTRGTTTYTLTHDGVGAAADVVQAFNITTAGSYDLRLVYFQNSGPAALELYSARASVTSWATSTAWQLVGTGVNATTNQGLLSLADAINVTNLTDAERVIAQPTQVTGGVSPRLVATSISRSGSTATALVPGHGFVNGQRVTISGADQSQYNGTFVISNVQGDQFDYTVSGTPVTPATGSLFAQAINARVTSLSRSGSTVTVQAGGHGLVDGQVVTISGADQTQYNGTFVISNVLTDSFQYTISGTPSAATGNIFFQPSAVSRKGMTAIVQLPGHGYSAGQAITISYAGQAEYNGTFTIRSVTPYTFSYDILGTPASPATGTIYARRVQQAWSNAPQINTINYQSTGTDGHFTGNVVFPNCGAVGYLIENLVMEVKTTISIPTAGNWTFGVNSDEGFRLTLTNGSETFTSEYNGQRTPGDTLTTFSITQPGAYRLRLVYFQNTAGAEVELFAAPGAWTAWSQTSLWRLIGDAVDGGLGTSLYDLYAVNVYQANISVTSLADAQLVLEDPTKRLSSTNELRSTVNCLDTGAEGHYADSLNFPGMNPGYPATPTDNFVVEVEASISITAAGAWTFGVSSDDGFQLALFDGATPVGATMQRTGTGDIADTLQVFTFPRADTYTMRLVYYHHTGEAELELFAASGSYTEFNPSSFRLVGDRANGGLAVGSGISSSDMYYCLQGLNPDGTRNLNYPVLLDVDNYIDYMLMNFYVGNGDWPGHNFYASAPLGPDGTGYKFYSWDAEFSLGLSSDLYVNRMQVYTLAARPWYYLASVPEFRLRFADHVQKHMFHDGVLTAAAATALYQEMAEEVEWAVIGESARWGDNPVSATPLPHTAAEWRTTRDWVLTTYLPNRTGIVLSQFRTAGLYPAVDAPEFLVDGARQYGGTFQPGDILSMSAAGGTIYYTVDGSDPRLPGGNVGPGAQIYSGPIALAENRQFKARIFWNDTWSALSEASFLVDLAPSIRITELMYNPAAPSAAEIAAGYNDAGMFEYIELMNVGPLPVPLSGLRFGNGIDFTFGNTLVNPGEYVVLASNPAAFAFRYPGRTALGPYTGQLSNAGETLELDSPAGGIIHQFAYGDGWYDATDGEGFSLTIRDPLQGLDLWSREEGWRASAAPGGSPGTDDTMLAPGSVVINEVLPHASAPACDLIELYNTTGEAIDLSGWFLSDSGTNLAKYQIAAGTVIAAHGYLVFSELRHFSNPADPGTRVAFALSEHGDDVYLSSNAGGFPGGYREHVDFGPAPDMVSAGLYQKASGGTDFTLLATPTFGPEPDYPGGPNSLPYNAALVLNEVMYHPADPTPAEAAAGFVHDDDFEFLELFNRSDIPLTLRNYYVGGGIGFTFGWYGNGTGSEVWTLESGATATWTTAALEAGEYSVYAHFTLQDGDDNRRDLDDVAEYVVTGVSQSLTITIDQNQPLVTGADVWVPLGAFSFNGTGSVQLRRGNTTADRWTIADQVKFVKTGHEVVVGDPVLDSFATQRGQTTIAPHSYLVLVANYAAFDMRYQIAANHIPVAGVYTGNMDNQGETIRLFVAGNPDPGVIPFYDVDHVDYSDRGSWPEEADGEGASMIRAHVHAYGDQGWNWRSSGTPGTPGAANIAIDRTDPSTPGYVTAQAWAEPAPRIVLTWAASTDPDSFVDHYRIWRDGLQIATVTGTSFEDGSVTSGVFYVYEVEAVNRDGEDSPRSTPVRTAVPGVVSTSTPEGTIQVTFTEALQRAVATLEANYRINGIVPADAILSSDGLTVFLTPGAAITPGSPCTIVISNLETIAGNTFPDALSVSLTYIPQGQGYLLREYWNGIAGANVSDLTSQPTYPSQPSGRTFPTAFEGPYSYGVNYGARMRGYLYPPMTGNYTFWISSDESSEVWLSTSESPSAIQRIAYVQGASTYRTWTQFPSQQSVAVPLVAGLRYYVEVLHKQGGGNDHCAVRWQLPDGSWENGDFNASIPGIRLSPWGALPDFTPPTAPENLTAQAVGSTAVVLSWSAAIDGESGVPSYAVYRDGTRYNTVYGTTFTDSDVSPQVRHRYQVLAINGDGFESPLSAALAVSPPGISWVLASANNKVHVSFTESIDPVTAGEPAHFAVSNVQVLASWLEADGITVTLTTSPMPINSPYDLSVSGLRRLSGELFPEGTQASFLCGGSILRENWSNIGSGTAITDLTSHPNFPNRPSTTSYLSQFEINQSITNSGERIRGTLVPDRTGNYYFYIASDDSSELWLSTTGDPANKTRIAYVPGSTNYRDWYKYPAMQKSAAIYLQSGRSYYIEALQKQGSGGNHITVAWQQPSMPFYGTPISGNYLLPAAPYMGAPPLAVSVAANTTTEASPRLEGTVSDYTAPVTVYVGGKYYAAVNNGDFTWSLPAGTIAPNLADGTYQVTAFAVDASGRLGSDRTTSELRIDHVAPTAEFVITPAPVVDHLQIVFSEPVSGLDLGDLRLTRDDGLDLLTGGETLSTTDGVTWALGGLAPITAAGGNYRVTLLQADSRIEDASGNRFPSDVTVTWSTDTIAPAAVFNAVAPNPRISPVDQLTLVFSEWVNEVPVAALRLTRDGGGNLLSGSETISTTDHVTWTLSGLSGLTARAGIYTCTLVAAGSGISDGAGNALVEDASVSWTTNSTIAGRRVFYNNSYFDGRNAAANSNDDNAIASDKEPLLPPFFTVTASFLNYTSYTKGLNGIIIDVTGLNSVPTAADFQFRYGNSSTLSSWTAWATPPAITVRWGGGVGGSDRVTLIWPDYNPASPTDPNNARAKTWLEVKVLATANTGLAAADLFYFGNAIGESGDRSTNAWVDGTDFSGARDNPHNIANRAAINDPFDYNRDSYVDGTDLSAVRDNNTNIATALKLITISRPIVIETGSQPHVVSDLLFAQWTNGEDEDDDPLFGKLAGRGL